MKIIYSCFITLFLFFNNSYAMEVAITIDDLPSNGNLPENVSREMVAKKIIDTLRKHHIVGVYGFVNGNKITNTKGGIKILKNWLANGHLLGNHTYTHLDLAVTSAEKYIEDIKQNETILRQLSHGGVFYFRYPFLAEGNTQKKRETVRKYLFSNQYHIAQVTVDFFEYEWNDPYVRCLNINDKNAIKWIKGAYIEQAINALTISHELSQMLFGRDIKNILLIHINLMTAEMLDDLLTAYEKKGVRFITLDNALTDNVYSINPNVIRDRSYTFLNQIRLSKKLDNPDIVKKLYDSLPEEKLSKICR